MNQKASISEALGTISSFFELINTGDISASTKDLLGNGHTQFDEAFFISEPLFWIHLNMDYPFNLKGILYFPKINTVFY